MAEIDKEQIARIVGHDDEKEYLRKDVSIIKDKRQFSIRIPVKFAELANIDPTTDVFEFVLIPEEEEGEKFTIEAKLKQPKHD